MDTNKIKFLDSDKDLTKNFNQEELTAIVRQMRPASEKLEKITFPKPDSRITVYPNERIHSYQIGQLKRAVILGTMKQPMPKGSFFSVEVGEYSQPEIDGVEPEAPVANPEEFVNNDNDPIGNRAIGGPFETLEEAVKWTNAYVQKLSQDIVGAQGSSTEKKGTMPVSSAFENISYINNLITEELKKYRDKK